jgi:TIR domain-containing protein
MADVFVSYSRRDSEFVGRVVESIEQRGKETWLDTEGLVDGEVFPAAIRRAIEQADTFLFVISPAAVESPFCESEVGYARDLRKRIVPVLRAPVPDHDLPAEIRDRNWIPFTERDAFDASMQRLLAALDRDPDHVRAHTRWLVKALEWDSEGRDKSLLLRGSELKAAEGWLASRPEDADPAPGGRRPRPSHRVGQGLNPRPIVQRRNSAGQPTAVLSARSRRARSLRAGIACLRVGWR